MMAYQMVEYAVKTQILQVALVNERQRDKEMRLIFSVFNFIILQCYLLFEEMIGDNIFEFITFYCL